ncbi:MAG: ATP-binding protein [Proteocatella sp.]
MSNIKTKLILYFTTLIAVILIILSVIALNTLKYSVINEVEKHLISNAKNSGKIILSRNEIIYTYLEGLACHKDIFNSGKTIDEQLKLLKIEADKSDNFIRIDFADKYGTLYSLKNSNNKNTPVDVSDREYFQKSIRGVNGIMTPTVSLHPDDEKKLIMVYSVPIYLNNEITGVLIGVTDAWILSDLFNDIKFGESGYAYILDSEGTVISHPVRKNVIEQLNAFEMAKTDENFKSVSSVLSIAINRSSGASEYTFNNRDLFMGYSKISGLDWLVVVTANQDEVLNGLFSAQKSFFVTAIVLLIISISICYFIGQYVFNKEKYITEKFNKVFENNPALMAIQTFPDFELIECNHIFLETLGYSFKELLEKSKTPSKSCLTPDITMQLKNNRKISNEEVRLTTKSGEKVDCIYSGELFEHGNKKYLLSVYTNITDKKNAEKELILAKENAESANKLKGQFLANMSHEIRTPINGVLGYLKLLEYTVLSDEQKEYTYGAFESSEILLSLIEDILDLSKIEAGKLQFEHINFSIREIVQKVVTVITPKSQEKNLILVVNISKDIPEKTLGDPLRISQVLTNLLSNAIKFTPSGSIVIDVSCPKKTPYEATVSFSVSDSGIGIAPDKVNAIFESFVQADSSTKRKYGGTGLGLAISKQIVEQMGGVFSIKSALNKGSTFSFEIPLDISKNMELELENPNSPIIPPWELDPDKAPPKILLVEDNKINQNIFKAFLKKKSLVCDVAINGLEAIESVKENSYNIIFMDCNLPVLDGFEATEFIRNMHPDRREIIIAVTASAMEGDRESCIAAGMDDYISKPLNIGALFSLIYKYSK